MGFCVHVFESGQVVHTYTHCSAMKQCKLVLADCAGTTYLFAEVNSDLAKSSSGLPAIMYITRGNRARAPTSMKGLHNFCSLELVV